MFVFDLDQIVPLERVAIVLPHLLESRLNSIKKTVLSLVTSCTENRQKDTVRKVPSFGFR